MKNIILGAGITGLSAAYMLKEVVVYEKDAEIGGLAKTIRFDGFSFDLGGHRFFTRKEKIANFVKELMGEELLEVNRVSKIYKDGKFLDYPLSATVLLSNNPFRLLRMLISYLIRKKKPLKEYSFREYIINHFGDELYSYYFQGYTEKILGISCGRISKEWANARIPSLSLKRVIKHALFKNEPVKSFTDKFLYPRRGIGTICAKLAQGLNIELNSEVTGLNCSQDAVETVIVNGKEIKCKNLISTIPLTKLIKMFNPPKSVINAAERLSWRDLICIFLVVDRKKATRAHWIYFPGGEVFGRLHEPKNWSPLMAPPEKTGICLEIFCNKGDDLWKSSDETLMRMVKKGLVLFKDDEIEDYIIKKVENAYPIYGVDFEKNVSIIIDYLARYNNLYLAGRTGTFKYLNMDDCIEEGMRVSLAIKNQK